MIDGFTAKNLPVIKESMLTYIKQGGLIVGHTLDNDM
jgi:hypothetical protein